jgi:hypothetical protein
VEVAVDVDMGRQQGGETRRGVSVISRRGGRGKTTGAAVCAGIGDVVEVAEEPEGGVIGTAAMAAVSRPLMKESRAERPALGQ